jgi:putative membrane protein
VALTDAQRARIEAAVGAAEATTSAEFVCAVTRAADTYFTVPLLVASGVALALPLAADALAPGWGGWTAPSDGVVALQLLAWAALAGILTRPAIAARITPRAVRARRAARLARAAFLELGLAGVAARDGVLLFVALAERHVEVIADRGVHAKVDAGAWRAVVDAFTAAVARGDVADGFVAALGRLAPILAAAFPRRPDDANEIPDRLVELG